MGDSSKKPPGTSIHNSLSRRTFLETAAGLLTAYPGLSAQEARLRSANPADPLAEHFLTPPDKAKPWVFWLWARYNNKDGITKDLEYLQEQGVGGILFGDSGPGQLSQPWNEGFSYLVHEASRLGLVVNANIADGFDTGGPWATPDVSAKKLVYTETQVQGPERADVVLPMPILVGRYYCDVAAIAFREDGHCPVTPYSVTASSTLGGYVDEWNWPPRFVTDRDPDTYWRANPALAPTKEKPAWLDLQFSAPLTASGLYVVPTAEGGPRECELQVGGDSYYQTVLSFAMEKGQAKRLSFPATTGRSFRLVIHSAYVPDVQIAEVWLLREGDEPRLRHGLKWWPFKSANRGFWNYPQQGPVALYEDYPEKDFDVRSAEVIDLAQNLDGHGVLSCQIPAGRWTILRFGYTLIPPRSPAAPNSESNYLLDLFKPPSADVNIKAEVGPMLADAGSLAGSTFTGVHIDSFEYGVYDHGQLPNWTDDFREQFRERRGYDLLPYLPTLARWIVENREVSNRFLWDFRRTLGDLYTAFYARLRELANQHNLSTNNENGYGTYPFPHIDGLEAFGQSDVPQGEFWTATPIMSQFYHFCDSVRTASSAAHIYGKPLVQSEAFSTWLPPYECYPGVMKQYGDQAFSDGLQQCVIFCSSNQTSAIPGEDTDGYEIINRHITWHKQAKAFLDYLGRCQYLLQQGQFVADALYFYGEGTATFAPAKQFLKPPLPSGYDFDELNADVLLNRLSAKPGRLIFPDGMSYRVLVLPEERQMSLQILRKVRELVEAGATVLGKRPLCAVGLSGYPQSDQSVKALADEMWGPGDTETGDRRLGQGRLVWGKAPGALLREMNVLPDFEVRGGPQGVTFNFTHRRLEGADIYFVANPEQASAEAQCVFRTSGRLPEIWDPVTGRVRGTTDFQYEGRRTAVPMAFAPYQSFFVVFRNASGEPKRTQPNFPVVSASAELEGPWTVHFKPRWGGPDSVVFETLEDWTKRPEAGIKYYSGTATYRKTFRLPQRLRQRGKRIMLDLGEMHDLAEVRLNGKNLGILWTKPFRLELTEALQPADNALEIDVVNVWTNRVIGDTKLPPDQRFTHGDASHFLKKNQPLSPSGLLGPVNLESV